MNLLYIFAGFVLATVVFFYLVYQVIAALLINANSKPIAEDQREVCKKALLAGKAGSPYCRLYIKKGQFGSKTCDVLNDS